MPMRVHRERQSELKRKTEKCALPSLGDDENEERVVKAKAAEKPKCCWSNRVSSMVGCALRTNKTGAQVHPTTFTTEI